MAEPRWEALGQATAQESYVFIAMRPRCAHGANYLGITVQDETGVEVFRCAGAQQQARGLEDLHRWPVGLVARRDVLEGALAAADDAAVPVDHCAVGDEHGLAAARAPRPRTNSLSRLAGADEAGDRHHTRLTSSQYFAPL